MVGNGRDGLDFSTSFSGALAAMVARGLLGNMVTFNSFGEVLSPRWTILGTPARQTEAATVSQVGILRAWNVTGGINTNAPAGCCERNAVTPESC